MTTKEFKPTSSEMTARQAFIYGALCIIASPVVYLIFHLAEVHGAFVRGPWIFILIYAFLGARGLAVIAALFGALLFYIGWSEMQTERKEALAAATTTPPAAVVPTEVPLVEAAPTAVTPVEP